MKIFIIAAVLSLFACKVYSQTQDTFKCYNASELRRIATRLIEKKECDSILSITNQEVAVLKEVILIKDLIIKNNNNVSKNQQYQIQDMLVHSTNLQHKHAKLQQKQKWLIPVLITSVVANIIFISTR
jgi:hypothetical protein